MLRYRLLLGTLFVIALAGLCWLDGAQFLGAPPGSWLFPLALGLSVLASGEMLWLLGAREFQPLPLVVYAGNLVIVASNAVPLFWPEYAAQVPLGRLGWPLCAFMLTVMAAFVGEMRRYEQPGRVVLNLAATVFSLAYVGLLLTFVVQLRAFGTGAQGMLALVSLVAVVKMGDTGAYTVGRLIGRHKMAPVLSPGKTWEGAAGAMLFAVFASWFVFGPVAKWMNNYSALETWRWEAYGLIVGSGGLLGDLAESLIKRDMGRKDSSAWMPGFGGVLDVLDSILFAAPIAYLAWGLGLVR